MPKNKFDAYAPSPQSSPTGAAAVTPHNTDELPFVSRIIYAGTGGTVNVVPLDNADSGTAVSILFQDGGQVLLEAVRILATGTSAEDIVIFA